MSEIIIRARAFALAVHREHTRYGMPEWPMSTHLIEVVELVQSAGGTDAEICAAWLHDTVEDSDTTVPYIEQLFGIQIATLVDELTDPPDFAALPLLERKTRQADRIRTKCLSTKVVKIADQTSNVLFLATYLPTHKDLIPKEWHHDYFEGAKRIVDNCKNVSDLLTRAFYGAYEKGIALKL